MQTYILTDRQGDRHTYIQACIHTGIKYRKTGRATDIHTYREAYSQTNKHADINKE